MSGFDLPLSPVDRVNEVCYLSCINRLAGGVRRVVSAGGGRVRSRVFRTEAERR